jgi:hypothetical protein
MMVVSQWLDRNWEGDSGLPHTLVVAETSTKIYFLFLFNPLTPAHGIYQIIYGSTGHYS